MYLNAVISCNQTIPSHLFEGLPLSNSFVVRENQLYFYGLKRNDWQAVLPKAASFGLRLATLASFRAHVVYDERFVFKSLNQSREVGWIGFVVDSPGNCSSRPKNASQDFSARFPGPCAGLVRTGIPLVVDERPTGYVCSVGDELIFHKRFLQVFYENNCTMEGDVYWRDRQQSHWARAKPSERCTVIAPVSIFPRINCCLCGVDYWGHLGVWLGNTDEPVRKPIARDEVSYGHLRAAYPMVVSIEKAYDLKDELGMKGYDLSPIYAKSHETSMLVEEFAQQVIELLGP